MKAQLLVDTKRSKFLSPLPEDAYWKCVRKFLYLCEGKPPLHLFYGRPEESGFYTGLLPYVEQTLKKSGVELEVLDRRPRIQFEGDEAERRLEQAQAIYYERTGRLVRDYQLDSVRAAVKSPGPVALEMCTGSGKSLTMSLLQYVINRPSMLVVHRQELLTQMERELAQVLDPKDIGTVGSGTIAPAKHTVGIINSILAHPRVMDTVPYVLFDECHMSAAVESRKMLLRIDAPIRHGFTGTYTRAMRSERWLLYSVSGPRVYHLPTSQWLEMGYGSRPVITMVEGSWRTTHGYDGDLHREAMISNYIVENDHRNRIACAWAKAEYDLGRRGFIFVNRIAHGERIREMLLSEFKIDRRRVQFVQGEDGTYVRRGALDGIADGSVPIIICTPIWKVGIDVPIVEWGINLTGERTEIGCRQLLGRLVRGDGTRCCFLLDFYDKNPSILNEYSEHRLSIYQSERAFIVNRVPVHEVSHEEDASKFAIRQAA